MSLHAHTHSYYTHTHTHLYLQDAIKADGGVVVCEPGESQLACLLVCLLSVLFLSTNLSHASSRCLCLNFVQAHSRPLTVLSLLSLAHSLLNTGHELVGAQPNSIKLSDGKKLDGGGRCVPITHIHKGVSPPLVFLWCLFSVALGPALVVLVRRAYVWHMARQINGGGDSEGGLTESLLGTVRTGWDSLMDRFRGATGGGSRDRGYGDADPNSW